jgi:hypothetical protein
MISPSEGSGYLPKLRVEADILDVNRDGIVMVRARP